MSYPPTMRLACRCLYALAVLALVGLAIGLSGCTALVAPGETVAQHDHGRTQDPGTAPADGQYVLMHKFVDATPLKTVSLSAGDRLGFMTGKTGEIVCVAGEDEWIWTDNDYIWVRRK